MSVSLYSNGQLANNTRGSWISTTAFNNDFFSYTTTVNPTTFQTTGTLGAVTGATAGTCPAGRVLRENGKKLYPEAHNGVSTYMIGVFDPVSFLSGFIDPNSTIFAVYNSNKPASLDTTTLSFAGGLNPNGGAADLAPPIYTAGTVTAVGAITSTTGDITATTGQIVASDQVRSSTVTDLTAAATIDIDCRLGQVFRLTPTSATAISATNVDAGASIYLIITSNGTSYNVTFNGGLTVIFDAGALATGTDTSKRFVIHFIADGSRWYEVSRTAALTA